MILVILFIISTVIYFYLKRKGKFPYKLTRHLYNVKLLLNILLIWIVIGFFLSLDYSDQWGCIIQYQPFWSKLNILFSSISFALILIAIVVRDKKMKAIFLILELVFWIGKLMVYKGGYAVGYAAFPQTHIVCYDIVALFLRFLVIRNVSFQLRTFYLATLTVIIILVKIFFFGTQQTILWEDERSLERAKFTMEKIQGKWTGERVYEETVFDTIISEQYDTTGKELNLLELIDLETKDTILKEKRIKQVEKASVYVDSNSVLIVTVEDSLNYTIEFNSEYSASLFEILLEPILIDEKALKTDMSVSLDIGSAKEIYIRKIDNDSLVFEEWMISWGDIYKLKKK